MSKDLLKDCRMAVLCGGRGVRMQPATDVIPKALVKLKGKPILDYILSTCRGQGFDEVTLCIGYKGELIKSRYQANDLGLTVHFSDAGEEAGMLKRISLLKEQSGDRFIVTYGDTFIDLDIGAMLQTHLKARAQATILTATIRNPFGLVKSEGGLVTAFQEKPLMDYYVGCFVVERSALEKLPADTGGDTDAEGLVNFFLALMRQKKLAAHQYRGPQITFNTETERKIAEENLISYYTLSSEE